MTDKQKFPTYKDHLNKSFLEELSYKIWVTKGTRFYASQRLLVRNEWSNKAIAFLSAYLIILGLLSVYQISSDPIIHPNLLAFSSTAISILVLLYSQIEFSQDYKMKSIRFHECSLKLAPLYNEIRNFKTAKESSEEEKETFGLIMSEKYQSILNNYDNHNDIDYKMFLASQSEYFEYSKTKVMSIKLSYYWQTLLIYQSLIALPIIVMIILVMRSKL